MHLNLYETVKAHIDTLKAKTELNIKLENKNKTPYIFSQDKKIILFRAVQESLTNAIKHGLPSHIICTFNTAYLNP